MLAVPSHRPMTKLNSRVTAFGVASIAFAALTALACVLLALAAMGIGTIVAFTPDASVGAGIGFGIAGVVIAVLGLVCAGVQGIAGFAAMNGRRLGFILGMVVSVISILSGFGGAWPSLIYGGFGVWALWTSRNQFQ